MKTIILPEGGPTPDFRIPRSSDYLETAFPPEISGTDLPDSPDRLYRIIRSLVKERQGDGNPEWVRIPKIRGIRVSD